MKLVACSGLALALCMVSSLCSADNSPACDILARGNVLYSAGKLEGAREVLEEVEKVDRLGKLACTDSVYATIGTTYMIRAEQAVEKDNKASAASLYKSAAKYNRAFANAVLCRAEKQCDPAKEFWAAEDKAK